MGSRVREGFPKEGTQLALQDLATDLRKARGQSLASLLKTASAYLHVSVYLKFYTRQNPSLVRHRAQRTSQSGGNVLRRDWDSGHPGLECTQLRVISES